MKPALRIRLMRYGLLIAAVLSSAIWMSSCRNDEPAIPPLTGPSGHRLFITMEATPDHLLIVRDTRNPQKSLISAQLKNQLGQGVPGEGIRLEIRNVEGSLVALGTFNTVDGNKTCRSGNQATCTTDSGGFIRADYIAPTLDKAPASTRVYIVAILQNPNYTFEITDKHAVDLELGEPPPGSFCGPNGLDPTFTFSPAAPVVGDEVCFDASATIAHSPVISVRWEWGDGHAFAGGGGDIRPCHTYTSAGIYNVTLTMQDENTNKCSSTLAVPVTSGEPPVCGDLVINPGGSVNVGVTYTFTSLATDPDSGIKNYSWNFGDGSGAKTSKSNSVTHRYTASGSFTLILTITDDQGNVTICTNAITVEGPPANLPPTCSFTISPSTGPVATLFTFNGSGSTDSDGVVTTYAWDFGDGSLPASGVSTSHTYGAAATFTVTLTVTDDAGASTTCSNPVVVTP